MKYTNHFDELILFDGASFEPPTIEGDTMKILAYNVILTSEHPHNTSGKEMLLEKALLIFTGVTKSVRVISEYAGEPKSDGFLPSYIMIDVSTNPASAVAKSFIFDGILKAPLSHTDWEIEADSFAIETL